MKHKYRHTVDLQRFAGEDEVADDVLILVGELKAKVSQLEETVSEQATQIEQLTNTERWTRDDIRNLFTELYKVEAAVVEVAEVVAAEAEAEAEAAPAAEADDDKDKDNGSEFDASTVTDESKDIAKKIKSKFTF